MSKANPDPETVIWTYNPIENVLAEKGVYKNAAEIDPNASKDKIFAADGTVITNPYTDLPKYINGWAYSEYCWTNFYPIGCGRLAAMVAGGIDREVVQINEDTCWDGSPYGTLLNENGDVIKTLDEAAAAKKISAVDFTGGSKAGGWRYFRGADENGSPAKIGSEAIVGDEAAAHPKIKSIAGMSLDIDNDRTDKALRQRQILHKTVEDCFLGSPSHQRAYKSFAEIYLDFGHSHKNAENYRKSLDLKTGVVTVEYDIGRDRIKRETFASYPEQAIVMHIESEEKLCFNAELHTYHNSVYTKYEKLSESEIKLSACVTDSSVSGGSPGTLNAIRFEVHMLLRGDGEFTAAHDNATISFSGGRCAEIYVFGATNYVDFMNLNSEKPKRDCDIYGNNIKSKTYEEIKARHLRDFTAQFSKTALSIKNPCDTFAHLPTEKRIRKDIGGSSGFLHCCGSSMAEADEAGVYTTYSEGDNSLAVLEFNFGKYLLISGARDGKKAENKDDIDIKKSRPLNLTGKWNAALNPSWDGKYTININTEMNYWAAQALCLEECERTLIDALSDIARSGSLTARNQYGITNIRGDNGYIPGDPWVTHHNFDLWCGTQPIDNATAGLWPTGGVWLLDHAWQYYLYNKDKKYLAEIYPIMLGAAEFFTQFLILDPISGYLITAASCSPEQGGVQPGPSMDTQLVRNLYDSVQKAAVILGRAEEDAALLNRIAAQMPKKYFGNEKGKIAPDIIGNDKAIREWVRGDVTFEPRKDGAEDIKPYHRHCSHLWELYPGTHLSAYTEDEDEKKLFEAFKLSVKARGAGDGKGWALAWRMCLNSRCLDGNTADKMLEQLLRTRTSPNMFNQHPNFQIDGNYGAAAGIAEMLLQSYDGAVTLLPALPERWSDGEFKGFNTREGVRADLRWKDGKPYSAVLYSREDKMLTVRSPYIAAAKITDKNGNELNTKEHDNTITFKIIPGGEYKINFK